MKDLLVFAADADAQAFMRSLLRRPQAIGIREVTFDVERHPLRDPGMVQSGAELVRMQKGLYRKALLMWDQHGSGRDRTEPRNVAAEIGNKLERFSWAGNYGVIILVPELELWLWYCERALAAHYGVTWQQLEQWVEDRAAQLSTTTDQLKQSQPKELFEYVLRERLRRTISPRDFEEIGTRSSIKALSKCQSFETVIDTLISWFPAPEAEH